MTMRMMMTFPGWGLAPGPPPSCLHPGTSQPASPTESRLQVEIDRNDDDHEHEDDNEDDGDDYNGADDDYGAP